MKGWVMAGALLIAADQAAKALVERFLPFQETVDLLPILALYRTHNTGIAFSMLSFAGNRALIALTLAIIVFVLFVWTRTDRGKFAARAGLALVLAGALGNLIDRAVFGHVIDFILLHWGHWSFAIFNLADSAISLGAALVLYDEIFGSRRRPAHGSGK